MSREKIQKEAEKMIKNSKTPQKQFMIYTGEYSYSLLMETFKREFMNSMKK